MSSRGRRLQTVARSGAVPVPALNAAVQRDRARGAGQYGIVAPPSAIAMRRFIEAQQCPWCATGPWKVLAGHTNKSHGVSGSELREMAGLIKASPICSAEISANARKRAIDRGASGALHAAPRAQRRPLTYSSAGAAAQRAKLAAVRAQNPNQQKSATAASRAKTIERMTDLYEQILKLWDSGLTLREVARKARVAPQTARDAIVRERPYADFIARRTESLSWRSVAKSSLSRGTDTYSKAMAAERAMLRDEFERKGGTRQALIELAENRGIDMKVLRARLRKAGAALPDGRKESPLMRRRRTS